MRFDPVDIGREAARTALRDSRQLLCARIDALQAQPDAAFIDGFHAAVAAVEAGFRHEEALQDLIGDTCLRTRRANDAVILCALHRVMPCVERGDVALGRQVLAALGDMLSLQPPFDDGAAPQGEACASADGAWPVRVPALRRSALHAVPPPAQRLS